MNLSLNPDLAKLIEQRVQTGQYDTPEAVVTAALRSLDQQEQYGDFAAGELDELLAEGERSIATEGTLDGEEAFQLRRARRTGARKPNP